MRLFKLNAPNFRGSNKLIINYNTAVTCYERVLGFLPDFLTSCHNIIVTEIINAAFFRVFLWHNLPL